MPLTNPCARGLSISQISITSNRESIVQTGHPKLLEQFSSTIRQKLWWIQGIGQSQPYEKAILSICHMGINRRCQNADDRHYNEQFNQTEPVLDNAGRCGLLKQRNPLGRGRPEGFSKNNRLRAKRDRRVSPQHPRNVSYEKCLSLSTIKQSREWTILALLFSTHGAKTIS